MLIGRVIWLSIPPNGRIYTKRYFGALPSSQVLAFCFLPLEWKETTDRPTSLRLVSQPHTSWMAKGKSENTKDKETEE